MVVNPEQAEQCEYSTESDGNKDYEKFRNIFENVRRLKHSVYFVHFLKWFAQTFEVGNIAN